MAQVTAFTAEKTLELLSKSITGAHLDGGDLILHRDNYNPLNPNDPETTINVGSIRGPTGPSGGISIEQMNTAIQNAQTTVLNDTGRGLLSIARYDLDEVLGQQANEWYPLTGISITSPPLILNRYYKIEYYAILTPAVGVADVGLDLELLRNGNTLHRVTSYSALSGRGQASSGSYVFQADSFWETSQLISMRMRKTQTGYVEVDNGYSPGFIALYDLGM